MIRKGKGAPQKGLIRANAGSSGKMGTRTGAWSPDIGRWAGMVVVEEGVQKWQEQEG